MAVLYLKLMFLCPQCDQLVQQYEPVLVQLLLQVLDPEYVCMVNSSRLSFEISKSRFLKMHFT